VDALKSTARHREAGVPLGRDPRFRSLQTHGKTDDARGYVCLVRLWREMNSNLIRVGSWLLRIALATGFLSAVADRFGLWGPPGSPGVAWEDLVRFNAYVAKLNWFMPARLIPLVGWASTVAEAGLALALLIGWNLRWVSLASALLLLSFAATMTVALGAQGAAGLRGLHGRSRSISALRRSLRSRERKMIRRGSSNITNGLPADEARGPRPKYGDHGCH